MPVLRQFTVTPRSTLTTRFQDAIRYCWRSSEVATVNKLAAYHNVIDPTADPVCRKCNLAPHTLQYWLQECPATASQRLQILGEADPFLSILVTDQQEAILVARETTPVTRVIAPTVTSITRQAFSSCQCRYIFFLQNVTHHYYYYY